VFILTTGSTGRFNIWLENSFAWRLKYSVLGVADGCLSDIEASGSGVEVNMLGSMFDIGRDGPEGFGADFNGDFSDSGALGSGVEVNMLGSMCDIGRDWLGVFAAGTEIRCSIVALFPLTEASLLAVSGVPLFDIFVGSIGAVGAEYPLAEEVLGTVCNGTMGVFGIIFEVSLVGQSGDKFRSS
jgi:hypothetical protein